MKKYEAVGALLGSAAVDADRIAFFKKSPGFRSKADLLRAVLDALRKKQAAAPTLTEIKTAILALQQQVKDLQEQLLAHGVSITPQAPYADSVDLSALDSVFTP